MLTGKTTPLTSSYLLRGESSDEDDDYDYDDDDMYDFFSSHFSFNIFEQMFGARFRGFRHGGPGYVYFGRDYGGTVPKSTDQIGEDYERRMANVVHCAAVISLSST